MPTSAAAGRFAPLVLATSAIMAGRPHVLERLDGYFAAGMLAHGYVANAHRVLAALGHSSTDSLALLRESAAIIPEKMPALVAEFRELGDELATQELLNPSRRGQQVARSRPSLPGSSRNSAHYANAKTRSPVP